MTPTEAMQALFDAWEKGDPEAAAALFTPDGRYEDPLWPESRVGPEAIREGCAEGMGAITDCRIEVRAVLEEGSTCFAEGYFASVLRDSGSRFDFPFAALVEMHDGRIARLAEYFDTRPLLP